MEPLYCRRIDRTSHDIFGIDFSSVTTMDDVASVLEASINEAIYNQTGIENGVSVSWSDPHLTVTGSFGDPQRISSFAEAADKIWRVRYINRL